VLLDRGHEGVGQQALAVAGVEMSDGILDGPGLPVQCPADGQGFGMGGEGQRREAGEREEGQIGGVVTRPKVATRPFHLEADEEEIAVVLLRRRAGR